MMTFPTFAQFHKSCLGFEPYPWQERVAEGAVHGDWPALIDIPTGLGKTSALLAAVYGVAFQAAQELTPGARSAPQRIIHVVDRRTVIDQTQLILTKVQEAILRHAELQPVREALQELAGPWRTAPAAADQVEPAEPLIVAAIHGESADTGAWLRPTGCSVLTMTPHQLVSRLLFRGYGVSALTRSIHAGLLGVDSLLLFDEPHLSHQAITTLQAILRQQSKAAQLGIPRTRMVFLGATVPPEFRSGTRRGLEVEDKAHSEAARRFTAARPVTLVDTAGTDAAVETALIRAVKEQRKEHGPERRVLVMVNTVAAAQSVHAKLAKLDSDAVLVTSRMRPWDRRRIPLEEATTVVATQCLEVGVDVSFPVLVTEACPYSALLQRLGRLNRDGREADPIAVVIIPQEAKVRPATAAIYGAEPVLATSAYLRSVADAKQRLDLSLEAQSSLNAPLTCWPATPRCATFHEGYTDALVTTYPTPAADLPIDSFVAGPDIPGQTDVLVCWREDLELLANCPPTSDEAVSIPLPAVRAFLAQKSGKIHIADIDHSLEPVADTTWRLRPEVTPYMRQDEGWVVVEDLRDLTPGTFIALPAEAGGYREDTGWDPDSVQQVSDHSLLAALESRRAPVRGGRTAPLTKGTVTPWSKHQGGGSKEVLELLPDLVERLSIGEADQVAADLQAIGLPALSPSLVEGEGEAKVVVSVPTRVEQKVRVSAVHQSLDSHQQQVADTCRSAGVAAGLLPELVDGLVTAGRWHDHGKDDPHFQAYLGNPSPESELWAKSRRGRVSRAVDRVYGRQVGYQVGWRHEGLSAIRCADAGHDWLTVHLVASHHGRSRPLLNSHVQGPGQEELPDHVSAFNRLVEKWGPWGLAYLESILRLADWRASAEPCPTLEPRPATRGESPHTSPGIAGDEIPLEGLLASPVTGWFAIAGLLRAAADCGDPNAVVRWTDLGLPIWQSSMSLERIADQLWHSPQWSQLTAADARLGGGLTAKNQKVAAIDQIAPVLRDAEREGAWLILGLLHDAAKPDAKGMPLPIAAMANNSSYPSVALRARAKTSASDLTAALTDPRQGWGEEQCDGGFDRGPFDGGITGREQIRRRVTRIALAPAALMGMAAFGASNQYGIGTNRTGRKLNLPTPGIPTTWQELGAAVRASGLPALTRVARQPSKSALVWQTE
jgi:CRISPR-associated endonuclease/helicase Cas3